MASRAFKRVARIRHRQRGKPIVGGAERRESSRGSGRDGVIHLWLIDRNGIQGIGRTEEVMALEPLDAKLRAFGFHVVVADGHDFDSVLAARDECTRVLGGDERPVAIIAETIKSHGIRYMQDTVDSHYLPMDDAHYEQALDELARAHESAVGRDSHAG
jgi:transketolase